MSDLSPMKKIDELIFQQCDEIKKTEFHQKLGDANSNIDDDSRPIVKLLASLLYFTILFGIIFYFFLSVRKINQTISMKEDIQTRAKEYIELNSQKTRLFTKLVSTKSINSESDLEATIKSSLGSIAGSSIKITESEVNEMSSDLKKSIADIEFKSISTNQFSTFVNNLKNRNKFQFLNSKIDKNEETELLDGVLSVMVFSK